MKRIPLTQGRFAIVDDEDFEMVSAWKWCMGAGGYASRYVRIGPVRIHVLMHRMILLPDPGSKVDHISGDKLDNRRANLRVCSVSENNCNQGCYRNNSSGYKGVDWCSRKRRWRAQIAKDGRHYSLGLFRDKSTAARVYDAAAREIHGAFASLNFPGEAPPCE
jgi:hypothetical protein